MKFLFFPFPVLHFHLYWNIIQIGLCITGSFSLAPYLSNKTRKMQVSFNTNSQMERHQDQHSPLKTPLPPDAGTGGLKLSPKLGASHR